MTKPEGEYATVVEIFNRKNRRKNSDSFTDEYYVKSNYLFYSRIMCLMKVAKKED